MNFINQRFLLSNLIYKFFSKAYGGVAFTKIFFKDDQQIGDEEEIEGIIIGNAPADNEALNGIIIFTVFCCCISLISKY